MREPSSGIPDEATPSVGDPGETGRPRSRQVAALRSFLASSLLWDGTLGVLCLLWALAVVRLFAPGRANVDIANQYQQATGQIPFSDWHPPIMAVVWRSLMDLTGAQASLLVLQVALLAAACWILCILVHRRSGSRPLSLLGPAVLLTPWVVSQTTTLWKDTQMAAALALGVLLFIVVRFVPKTWALVLPAFLLLVYALGLRKNALFALVPIAVYIAWVVVRQWSQRRRRRQGAESPGGPTRPRGESPLEPAASAPRRSSVSLLTRRGWATAGVSMLVLVLLGGGLKATDALISARTDVAQTGQISQIFLDDVMFSVPEDELMATDAPAALKAHINSARDECLAMGEIWDAYWNCYGRGETGEPFTPIAHQDALKDLWLSEVITHPVRYIGYRAAVFSHYFFTTDLVYWPADWHGEAGKAGIAQGSQKADHIVRPYVEDFALGTFPMLFTPWFWALLAGGLLVAVCRAHRRDVRAWRVRGGTTDGRAGRFRPEISMLAASALVYILGYFPIAPANHFRYTFWPALAVTIALVLWSAARSRAAGATRVGGSPGGLSGGARPGIQGPRNHAD
ncbi:hypothetical protein DFO66_101468 [Brevibacterium sanguinis]|uniref:Dolichyl-phosphate-mannose-protein mannosyltransferase n=2 Tax=Brevibacterium TaxID=1696 RepID=A0A366IMN5_9MICO|nr:MULTISPECIES: hypothetical protein [Brevibacterium]RBP68239.1 hypothetical protein DFO66_101468 [Brevibacterium sanguinis]RBP74344.1 hypothetical protein DFO65_10161 [Brevibacterium celere]